ncbi:Uncharacterised protein [uncultured archaeon]|nr:Uncharacterised protein [uncultured archaeon]
MSTKQPKYSLTARISGDIAVAFILSIVAFLFSLLIRFSITHTADPLWYIWLNFFTLFVAFAIVIDRWDNGPFRRKRNTELERQAIASERVFHEKWLNEEL